MASCLTGRLPFNHHLAPRPCFAGSGGGYVGACAVGTGSWFCCGFVLSLLSRQTCDDP